MHRKVWLFAVASGELEQLLGSDESAGENDIYLHCGAHKDNISKLYENANKFRLFRKS